MNVNRRDSLFHKLIEPYYCDIYYYICARLDDRHAAEDLLQETMMAAWRNVEQLREVKTAKAWVYRIAENRVNRYYRGLARQRSALHIAENVDLTELECIADTEEQVLDCILHNERMDIMKEAMEQISDEQRTAIILRAFEEFKFKEISEILNVNESTVKQRFIRGGKKLRVIYEKMVRDEDYK